MILSTPAGNTPPCTSSANSTAHPYYFVATGYGKADAANRMLHRLCSWLNHAGQESWMVTTDTHAQLWTPRVHDHVRAQHHAANKCPIVIYSDKKLALSATIGKKVCYQFDLFAANLNHASDADTLTFAWTGDGPGRQLRLPFLNLNTTPSAGPRTLTLVYAQGYLAAGGLAADLPPQATRLTQADLAQEDALLARLAQAHTLFLFEPSVLTAMARAQGCTVVHVRNARTWPSSQPDNSLLGTVGVVETTDWRSLPAIGPWHASAFVDS